MIQLVQDLLLLARLEAGHDHIALIDVRVDEVLLRVVARLQKLALKKQVQLTTHFSSDIPGGELEGVVKGDEDLLDSMFENFIENSICGSSWLIIFFFSFVFFGFTCIFFVVTVLCLSFGR